MEYQKESVAVEGFERNHLYGRVLEWYRGQTQNLLV